MRLENACKDPEDISGVFLIVVESDLLPASAPSSVFVNRRVVKRLHRHLNCNTDRTITGWTVSLVCARRTPLHAAAFAEDVAGLQLVLRHGTEINAVDKSGRSALMVAADKGHSGTVGESA